MDRLAAPLIWWESILAAFALALWLGCATSAAAGRVDLRPNIVVIMTDDQDDIGSISTMPEVNRLLVDKGIKFTNSFVDFPLCCPSRTTFLTGQNAHNHGVVENEPPDGGYEKFAPREGNSLGVWLQDAGYITGLAGKVMNGYGLADPTHIPPGWSEWYGRVEMINAQGYYGYALNENGVIRSYGHAPRDYFTDVLARKGVAFIARQAPKPKPFFLLITPKAPHQPPVPAPRHAGLFASEPFPPRPNFNEADVTDKPGFIRALPPLSAAMIAREVDWFRKRKETLLAVDDLVRRIVAALRTAGVLDNTIIIFTSDNGLSPGAHRWRDKWVLYEESIRVPLIMRGPGIPRNQKRNQLVTNLDVVATILQRTGATAGSVLDGKPLTPIIQNPGAPWRTAFMIHGTNPLTSGETLEFLAIRTGSYIFVKLHSLAYGSEEEFYDLVADPYQLRNKAGAAAYQPVIDYLRDKLDALSTCVGESCWVTGQPPPPLRSQL